ncbi:MAG: dienelactone hydrolase family protein [Nitrospirae bacterium]|nr:MAG: dienelactone hydrolase family protein [Nitrospirota bacterium]
MTPTLKEETVQYPSEGVTMRAYVAAPEGTGPFPAVIVVQEWWGLNDHIKDIARRLAREDYVAIAPDLYTRLGHKVTADPNEAGQLMNSLRQEDGLKDLNATVAYLKTRADVRRDRIGITGFCMGGGYALLLPCINAEIKAAVPYYGPIPNPDTPLQQLAAPILYIFGEDDGWITKADVERLRTALKTYQKAGEIKTYPGCPHAFFNDTRPDVYKAAEAQDAWTRTLAFFAQHLKGEPVQSS